MPKKKPARTASGKESFGPKRFNIVTRPDKVGEKVVIYGQPKVGKTTLCTMAPRPVFCNLDGDPYLKAESFAEDEMRNWQDMRSGLMDWDYLDDYDTIVIDSATRAEEWCANHVIDNVPHPDKPDAVISTIESYGYGKGFTFIFEQWCRFMAQLDKLVRSGKNIVLTAHPCKVEVRDPMAAETYEQWQPRLQSLKSGNNSIRHKVMEWCSNMVFMRMDDDNVTRLVYFQGSKGHWAGTRNINHTGHIEFTNNGQEIWNLILNGDEDRA